MRVSSGPIGVPARSSFARTPAYASDKAAMIRISVSAEVENVIPSGEKIMKKCAHVSPLRPTDAVIRQPV